MPRPDAQRVARQFLATRRKEAGEVRFIKDRSGDATEWAWNSPGPSAREMGDEFVFDAKHLEPVGKALRAWLSALGFAMSGYHTFAKIKSATISPDGNLGGKGYIMKVPDIRRQVMNCIEVLSSITDTLYDEVNAPHWHPAIEGGGKRERGTVQDLMEDVEEIKANPEAWAEGEEAEMDADPDGAGTQPGMAPIKTAARQSGGLPQSRQARAALLGRAYIRGLNS